MTNEHFVQGKEAYSDDKELSDNPYPAGSAARDEWKRGFEHAERNDPFSPENL